jgi:hypothetical protein
MFSSFNPISLIEQRDFMKSIIKFFLILFFSLSFAHSVSAEIIDEKDLYFKPDPSILIKNNIQSALVLLSPSQLLKKFPEAIDLDSVSGLKQNKVKVLFAKTAFVVDKPIGFFDHEHMQDLKYLKHIYGEQKVDRIQDSQFTVIVPGATEHSYQMNIFFDSDDISTLPRSKIIQGVNTARKFDVLSQGANSIIFQEFTKYSKYLHSGINIQMFSPLKAGKTLVINYQMMFIKKHYAIKGIVDVNYLEEIEARKNLMSSFKE